MADRTTLNVAAATAAASGLLALVTGNGLLAFLAGVASIASAVLAVRLTTGRDAADGPASGGSASDRPTSAPTDLPDPAAAAPSPPPGPATPADAPSVPAAGPAPADLADTPDPDEPAVELPDVGVRAGPADERGLLTAEFLASTLRSRVAVARRALRPLSIVHFESLELTDSGSVVPVDRDAVTRILERTLRESDVAGQSADGSYAFVLEDTGEDGAVWTAERLRRNLAADGPRRFRAGVASYPSHGLEPEELEAKAGNALRAARDWSADRIEVAEVS